MAHPEATVVEVLDEGTVTWIGAQRVPMGNVRVGPYPLPDGALAQGPACALALPEGPVVVGQGSEVAIDGRTWRVLRVTPGAGGTGSVTLQLADQGAARQADPGASPPPVPSHHPDDR